MKINNIIAKTLFDKRRSSFFWSLGIIAMSLFYALIYKSIGNNPDFTKALESTNTGIKSLIGSAEFFSTPAGFIHAEFFSLTMPIIFCILAIIIGSSLLSREEESKTIELILARPISRGKIIFQYFISLFIIITTLGFSVIVGLSLGRFSVSVFNLDLFISFIASINLVLIALAFGSLALLISVLKPSRGTAGGIAGLYFIVSYIISTFGNQVSWLKLAKPFSLFKYYDSMNILQHNIKLSNFVVLIIISLICLVLSCKLIYSRDL